MAQLVRQFASGIYNLVLGLFTSGKHLGRHAITIQYPKERWEVPERSRGMVVLLTDQETGELNCTACLLCMRACPSSAIDIEVEKDEKGKRHLKGFKVDFNICCFCGLCEDSCNFAGIKLSTKYEFPTDDKTTLVYDMKRLAEEGLDVPYEKPVRKKPAPKPAPKPAAAKTDDAPAKPQIIKPDPAPKAESATSDDKPEDDKPHIIKPAPLPTEKDTPAGEAKEETPAEPKPPADTDTKEDGAK